MAERFERGIYYRTKVSRESYRCTLAGREQATLQSSKGVSFEVSQGIRDYYEEAEPTAPSSQSRAIGSSTPSTDGGSHD